MPVQVLVINNFITEVKMSQTLWALKEPVSDDWVVLDSIHFEKTDVMPLWSSEEKANAHCVDEWSGYQPAAISIAEWMEFWIEDLNDDGIIIGVDWVEDNNVEIDLSEFTHYLSEIEQYK